MNNIAKLLQELFKSMLNRARARSDEDKNKTRARTPVQSFGYKQFIDNSVPAEYIVILTFSFS